MRCGELTLMVVVEELKPLFHNFLILVKKYSINEFDFEIDIGRSSNNSSWWTWADVVFGNFSFHSWVDQNAWISYWRGRDPEIARVQNLDERLKVQFKNTKLNVLYTSPDAGTWGIVSDKISFIDSYWVENVFIVVFSRDDAKRNIKWSYKNGIMKVVGDDVVLYEGAINIPKNFVFSQKNNINNLIFKAHTTSSSSVVLDVKKLSVCYA